MKIPKEFKNEYVCWLPERWNQKIMSMVCKNIGEDEKEGVLLNASLSKTCDLTNVVNIEFI